MRTCLVPVRLSPRPSRSIRFGDVAEANIRGKRRHKKNARVPVLSVSEWRLKMADFPGVYKLATVGKTAANYGYKTVAV